MSDDHEQRGRLVSHKRGRLKFALGAAAIVSAVSSSASPLQARARDDYTAWQEITVLTVSKLENAAANCGFTINGKQLSVLLQSADLTLADVHTRKRSADLQRSIDEDAGAFRADRETGCAKAWDTFGDDAAPGVRDFLQK